MECGSLSPSTEPTSPRTSTAAADTLLIGVASRGVTESTPPSATVAFIRPAAGPKTTLGFVCKVVIATSITVGEGAVVAFGVVGQGAATMVPEPGLKAALILVVGGAAPNVDSVSTPTFLQVVVAREVDFCCSSCLVW